MLTVLRTGPTEQPVSLDDVKTHLNIPVSNTLFDLKLSGFIDTAVGEAEYETGRKLITQQWSLIEENWPTEGYYGSEEPYFKIPFGELNSVDSIEYKTEDGTVNTLSSSVYYVDTYRGCVGLNYDQSWPTDTLYVSSPIDIKFTCGWTAATVPDMIKAAILIRIADYYENLEDIVLTPGLIEVGNIRAFSRLLYKHRYIAS